MGFSLATHGKGATGKSPSPIAKLSHQAPVGKGPVTAPHSGPGRRRCFVVVVNGKAASLSRETRPGVSRTTPESATCEKIQQTKNKNSYIGFSVLSYFVCFRESQFTMCMYDVIGHHVFFAFLRNRSLKSWSLRNLRASFLSLYFCSRYIRSEHCFVSHAFND